MDCAEVRQAMLDQGALCVDVPYWLIYCRVSAVWNESDRCVVRSTGALTYGGMKKG